MHWLSSRDSKNDCFVFAKDGPVDSSSEGHLQILFLVLGLKEFAFQGLKIKVREHSKQDEDVVDFSPLLREKD